MQAQRTSLGKLPEGYEARKFTVHVGGRGPAYKDNAGYEGLRVYKTESGARRFAVRANEHFGKVVYIEESWRRVAGWWVSGLREEGQIALTYRDGVEVDA